MAVPADLESLYQEAQSALKAKDYDRAAALLKQILITDENYRDTSRLLAQTVRIKRRRWYNDLRFWGPVIGILVIGLLSWIATMVDWKISVPSPPDTSTDTSSLTTPSAVPSLSRPILTPTLSSRTIPLAWKRVYIGQEFTHDAVTTIVVDSKDQDVIYIGTRDAGIYKSIDGGLSWQPVQSGLGRGSIDTLAIDPTNPHILFAGVLPGGLYKTTNGGQTWQVVDGGFDLNVKWIASLVLIDPKDSQHVLYSPAFSLYESSDGGGSWKQIRHNKCPEVMHTLLLDPTDKKTLFAIDTGGQCQNGLFVSHDGGESWSLAVEGSSSENVHLAGDASGEKIYADVFNRLFLSLDHGATWNDTGQMGCFALAVSPIDGNIAYCARGSELIQTIDGGKNWIKLGKWSHDRVEALTISPHDSSTLLAGTEGLFISTDSGVSWEEQSNGLGASRLELKLTPGGSSMFIEQNGCTFYRSSDGGVNWESVLTQYHGCDLEFDADGQTQYLRTSLLLRSTDQGQSWNSILFPQQGNPNVIPHPNQAGEIFVLYDNPPPWAGYISLDRGTTWKKMEGNVSFWNGRIYSSHNNPDILYNISASFLDPLRSDDGGKSWKNCLRDFNIEVYVNQSDTRAIVDPLDINHIAVATQGTGILVSRDGCATWQPSNTGLGSLYVNTVAIDINNPNVLYAGTDGGAYISTDGGNNWGQVNDGLLGATVVYSIVVDMDSHAYAATPYGIFRLESH